MRTKGEETRRSALDWSTPPSHLEGLWVEYFPGPFGGVAFYYGSGLWPACVQRECGLRTAFRDLSGFFYKWREGVINQQTFRVAFFFGIHERYLINIPGHPHFWLYLLYI